MSLYNDKWCLICRQRSPVLINVFSLFAFTFKFAFVPGETGRVCPQWIVDFSNSASTCDANLRSGSIWCSSRKDSFDWRPEHPRELPLNKISSTQLFIIPCSNYNIRHSDHTTYSPFPCIILSHLYVVRDSRRGGRTLIS